jgi:hypothetical protein
MFLVAGCMSRTLYLKHMSANRIRNLLIVLVASSNVVGCAGLNDPYDPYYGSGGGGPYGGGGYYGRDPYYGGPGYGGASYQDRRERERLEEERRRLERERERLERERERQDSYRPPPPPPPQYRPPAQYDRCPAGFSPSENKCSKEERKRGCKDIRMPSGLGCVKR